MHWLTSASENQLKVYLAAAGLIGGVVGGLLGFLSNQIATSRQIARQERGVRRRVYIEYLHSLIRVRRLLEQQDEAVKAISDFNTEVSRGLLSSGIPNTDWLDSQRAEMGARAKRRAEETLQEIEHSLLLGYDLSIYAPSHIWREAQKVERMMTQFFHASNLSESDNLGQAKKDLYAAEVRFINYVRADVRAPDYVSRQAIPLRTWLSDTRERFRK